MFGSWGKKQDTPQIDPATVLGKEPERRSSSSSSLPPTKSTHGFDPSGLERAAKAAKELDQSKNAKEALNLIQLQEVTKQKEHEMERARFMAHQQDMALRNIKEEEQRNIRNFERQIEADRAKEEYSDQLERKRRSEELEADEQKKILQHQRDLSLLEQKESLRRRTIEYENELRAQTELTRTEAEIQGRIRQERENQSLKLETIHVQSLETRETILEAIKLATSTIGNGVNDLLNDRNKLLNATATITTIVFGFYFAKVSTAVAGRFIEARLGKPSLVRETTRMSPLQIIRNPSTVFKLTFGSVAGEKALKNIVLAPELDQRLRRVATSTANTKKHKAPFRHLLLHGPPGTGKTMFAKGLARESGLHYAIMTGGDIAPLGKDAVTEIHKLFDWSNSTSKGVLLFVDEADAFLRKRSTEVISEDSRNALNAFLYRTGEASKKFMIVYASNQPDQFDWAINDRIDEMIEFELPTYHERLRMIKQYLDEYVTNSTGTKITVIDVDDDTLKIVAEKTEGFSGREISKLAIAWQAAALGTVNATLTQELLYEVLDNSIETKEKKKLWLSTDEVNNL
eukprot:CAMPEP_0174821998 /NCGR_PEP_ID=MMETSP1107-20130205/12261_1 /TAXON_ID=36770 /ORGANISM="Paraphysomonas vestita, Strain GFlagA" /LENGTH=571 /DNA_ID=CAMNT_0016039805 /DNA_START=33 /DNA_END=1745 /DNA_ORIENTATION=-